MDGENLNGDLLAGRAQALALVRQGFAAVSARPEVFTNSLYEDFFTSNPRYRKYFAAGDEARRDERTMEAATRVLAGLDRPGTLLPLLRRLALEYRKYGVREPHYRAFAGSVMTALERTIGEAWTYEAAAAWVDELTMVASAMLGIAAEADAQGPAYWEAEVVAVDRMGEDVVRLRVRTAFPYPYQAGQYAAIELGRLPWVWRDFSFAAAPEAGAEDPEHSVLEFHVQRTADGRLSNVVHDELEIGDRIRIAAPAGDLAFPAGASRLIAVGHGTGLAPIAALLQDAAAAGDDRPVHIVVGNSLNAAKPAKKTAAAKKTAKAGAAKAGPAAAKKAQKTAKAAAPAAEAAGGEDADQAHYLTERLAELAAAHGNAVVVFLGAAEELPQHLDEYVKRLADGGTLSGWGGVAVGSTGTVQACLGVLAAAGADPADVRSDLFG
ncbi:Oxidoreductase FAD-binding domain protein [Catenulispora acidiphila DSM 44928]|uniref:nitric oxide dioxygenase n=1 Tax=Catenulispora acidiphila (strain DSM 44928 / JCM 14897 / NBRC 102108 / NRRL B-24433 / ID139908) TaxID=479433 RepID=C7PWU1_CATAD|nr:Oxidoreductase FAD-binding domain protein [Catenulispora acidiphila DSM 44928]